MIWVSGEYTKKTKKMETTPTADQIQILFSRQPRNRPLGMLTNHIVFAPLQEPPKIIDEGRITGVSRHDAGIAQHPYPLRPHDG